jgi:transposase
VIVRLTRDQRTKTYLARAPRREWRSDIVRCLKRYVAREVFHALVAKPPALTRISA